MQHCIVIANFFCISFLHHMHFSFPFDYMFPFVRRISHFSYPILFSYLKMISWVFCNFSLVELFSKYFTQILVNCFEKKTALNTVIANIWRFERLSDWWPNEDWRNDAVMRKDEWGKKLDGPWTVVRDKRRSDAHQLTYVPATIWFSLIVADFITLRTR